MTASSTTTQQGSHAIGATSTEGHLSAVGPRRILAGFALLYAVHVAITSLTTSLYGEYGLLACALVLATALAVERLAFGRGPRAALGALGLGRPARGAIVAAILIALLMVATGTAYALIAGTSLTPRGDWTWLALGIVAQYGIAEEVIFRGFLFGHLRVGRTFRHTLAIATLVFAAAHLPMLATNGPMVGLAGIALAVVASLPFVWLYERGGATIWAPVILHAVAHAPKLLAPGTLDAPAELTWIAVVMTVPYLAFVLPRRGHTLAVLPAPSGARQAAGDAPVAVWSPVARHGRPGEANRQAREWGIRVVGWLAAFLAGACGSGLGLAMILPLGLVVVEWVVFPLALVAGALLAALAAGWVGTWVAGDGTRTRLAAAVAVTEATGLGLALIVLVSPPLRTLLLGPVIGLAGLSGLALALAAGAATWALRRPAGAPHRDRALTLLLLALALVGVPVVLVLAGLAGLTGA